MGAIIECTRCGYRTSDGFPGRGLWIRAKQLTVQFYEGKNPSKEKREKKCSEISKKLTAEYLEAQKESQKGHENCRTILDVLLFRKSTNRHKFKCVAMID